MVNTDKGLIEELWLIKYFKLISQHTFFTFFNLLHIKLGVRE